MSDPLLELVLIGDPAVVAVPVLDCGEPLVHLADAPPVRTDDRLVDTDGAAHLVRAGVAERLARAARQLPPGTHLAVVEGLRPLALQARYFDEYVAELAPQHPDLSHEALRRLASRYIAPPTGSPPHSTGGAVDLTLVDDAGRELDLGTAVNATPEESQGKCATGAAVGDGARALRDLLAQVLSGAGLVNYPTEWWHWSYGDQYWALRTGAATAPYGSVALPSAPDPLPSACS